MNTRAVDSWVEKYGWKVVQLLIASVVAWTTLQAQIAQKVDRAEFLPLMHRIDTLSYAIREMHQEVDALMAVTCQTRRNEIGCQLHLHNERNR